MVIIPLYDIDGVLGKSKKAKIGNDFVDIDPAIVRIGKIMDLDIKEHPSYAAAEDRFIIMLLFLKTIMQLLLQIGTELLLMLVPYIFIYWNTSF